LQNFETPAILRRAFSGPFANARPPVTSTSGQVNPGQVNPGQVNADARAAKTASKNGPAEL
jgi:hypothetical protein